MCNSILQAASNDLAAIKAKVQRKQLKHAYGIATDDAWFYGVYAMVSKDVTGFDTSTRDSRVHIRTGTFWGAHVGVAVLVYASGNRHVCFDLAGIAVLQTSTSNEAEDLGLKRMKLVIP